MKDGRLIDPNFWCIAFEKGKPSRDVERFQVVYRAEDRVRFRIVRRASYTAQTETDLREFITQNFGNSMQVEFEYVSEIKPQASGKFLFVVNEIASWEEEFAHV
jgi:hypothetical protein